MSDLDPNWAGLAGLHAIQGVQDSQQRAADKIVRAIEELKKQDNPLTKRYKLLAANGCDLIAQCDHCNQNMRFLPEYAGQTTECLHCKNAIILCLLEDLSSTQCRGCNSTLKYINKFWSVDDEWDQVDKPIFCSICRRDHIYGICPHCKKDLFMRKQLAWINPVVCPNCQGKMEISKAESDRIHSFIERRLMDPEKDDLFFIFSKPSLRFLGFRF